MLKVTLCMNQSTGKGRVGGFSETWYKDGTVQDTVIPVNALWKARQALLSSTCRFIGYRVQEVGGKGTFVVRDDVGLLQDAEDIPQMALNVYVDSATTTARKTFQLRGWADTGVEFGDYKPANSSTQMLAQMNTALVNGLWRFRSKKQNPKVGILSIAANGDFVLTGDLVFVQGSYIDVMRAKNSFGQNVSGRYYVQIATNARSGKFADWPGTIVGQSGKARVSEFEYVLIKPQSLTALYITTRRVGRPFGLYRGRATR